MCEVEQHSFDVAIAEMVGTYMDRYDITSRTVCMEQLKQARSEAGCIKLGIAISEDDEKIIELTELLDHISYDVFMLELINDAYECVEEIDND